MCVYKCGIWAAHGSGKGWWNSCPRPHLWQVASRRARVSTYKLHAKQSCPRLQLQDGKVRVWNIQNPESGLGSHEATLQSLIGWLIWCLQHLYFSNIQWDSRRLPESIWQAAIFEGSVPDGKDVEFRVQLAFCLFWLFPISLPLGSSFYHLDPVSLGWR